MKEINLTQEPSFGEDYKDVIFKLKIIKAIVEGGDWGKAVLKFVDPNAFSVQVGGLHIILGVIKEIYMETSEIPSIDTVKETIYTKYVNDDIDKEIYDTVFNEYDKIYLNAFDIKTIRSYFANYYIKVTLKRLKMCMEDVSFTSENDLMRYVNRLIKILEELKFYAENRNESTGMFELKEW